jgi:hypothetical protein
VVVPSLLQLFNNRYYTISFVCTLSSDALTYLASPGWPEFVKEQIILLNVVGYWVYICQCWLAKLKDRSSNNNFRIKPFIVHLSSLHAAPTNHYLLLRACMIIGRSDSNELQYKLFDHTQYKVRTYVRFKLVNCAMICLIFILSLLFLNAYGYFEIH